MNNYLFFDSASTTKCSEAAIQLIRKYATEDFGNPSSTHLYGQKAARAIREARHFFAQTFRVEPEQVIFTGSGTEANNLAIYGTAIGAHLKSGRSQPVHILASAIEHPAVGKTVASLADLGIQYDLIPVDSTGQLVRDRLFELLRPSTALMSVHQVNNIVGAVLPVEEIAREAKSRCPHLIVHTDSVQAFGKIKVPQASSGVDLVSISGHKIEGPKGIGALIVLKKHLLKNQLRPLIWGGGQENGFRSGTQNAGLIAGFHSAAEEALENLRANETHVEKLKSHFRDLLIARELLSIDPNPPSRVIRWNSPAQATPYIVSLGFPGFPAGPLSKLLEERGCLVSIGSACTARKPEPDPVLDAMGFPAEIQTSTLRVSFSKQIQLTDVEKLVHSLEESLQLMTKLLGKRPEKARKTE